MGSDNRYLKKIADNVTQMSRSAKKTSLAQLRLFIH